jgi:hypothetical protein
VNPPPPENVATAFAHSSDSFRRSIALGWHSIPLGDTRETLVASFYPSWITRSLARSLLHTNQRPKSQTLQLPSTQTDTEKIYEPVGIYIFLLTINSKANYVAPLIISKSED